MAAKSTKDPADCRHEYVRIYQRKLKGLERRLVATKAWLPVGFKMTDFTHLGEGSYCFCSACRTRLFPKRTAAEKAQAKLALAAEKAAAAELEASEVDAIEDTADEVMAGTDIHVEELELETVELQDLDERSVSLEGDESSCQLSGDD